jgi:hypothetical protein
MDLATIDSSLTRLRATVAVMSTNLVDLENDAGRARLDQAALTGTTAARWAEARSQLAFLWQWFAQLKDVLDKATELRGTKGRLEPATLTQLDWLVNGPSIELATTDVPLAQRGLFGPTETTMRCSPPELLDRMRSAFDQAVAVIGDCTRKWAGLEPQLQPLEAQLSGAQRIGKDLGEKHHPELDRVGAQLEELRQTVACDPLAAADDCLDAVGATLASVMDDLQRQTKLKDDLAIRLADARPLVADLRGTVAAAAAAQDEARAKIAHPEVVDPPPGIDDIERELAQVEALAAQGDWRAANSAFVQWTTRCRDATSRADQALAANRAPLAARNELRGRLDAYQAKAYRTGRLEDPTAAALHARALKVLFTAPTNLDEAEQLVRHYQQVVSGPAPRQVAP